MLNIRQTMGSWELIDQQALIKKLEENLENAEETNRQDR